MKENRVQVDMDNAGEPLCEFWNKGGFVLCTAGYADIRINERMYRLIRGGVFVVTLLVQVYDFRPSPDFAKISFVRKLKDFYLIFCLISDTGIPLKVKEKSCWQISEAEVAESFDGRNILMHLVYLIGPETMLEIVCNHIRRYSASVDSVRNHSGVAYRFILALYENYRIERTMSLVLVADMDEFSGTGPRQLTMATVDVGIVCENISVAAAGLGLASRPRGSMNSSAIQELLGLNANQIPIMNNIIGYPANK